MAGIIRKVATSGVTICDKLLAGNNLVKPSRGDSFLAPGEKKICTQKEETLVSRDPT